MKGERPTGWQRLSIGQIARIIGGSTPSTKIASYWNGSIPWITPKDLSNYSDRYILAGARNITKEGLENSGARVLPRGTVLVSSRAPIGYIAIADAPLTTNQGFRSLVLHSGHIPEFFYYVLKSSTVLLESRASGTTFRELSGSAMAGIEVPVPPFEDQRRIAAMLGALDDKIAANRRMNATLDALARTIFRKRFAAFAPGDALPDGWTEKPIGEVARAVGGSTPSTKNPEFWKDGTIRWTSPKDLSNVTVPVLLDTERRITQKGLATISSGLLPVNTVLLSSRAPIGYLVLAKVPVAVNQGFIALPPGKTFTPLFLYQWIREHLPEIKAHAGGTTFPEISKRSFRGIPAIVPAAAEIADFEYVTRPLFDKIIANEQQSRTLATLRDTLLPKLLSGTVSMCDAEACFATESNSQLNHDLNISSKALTTSA